MRSLLLVILVLAASAHAETAREACIRRVHNTEKYAYHGQAGIARGIQEQCGDVPASAPANAPATSAPAEQP